MKKLVLLLSLLAGISASASAQVTFGVKAGPSYTNYTGPSATGETYGKVTYRIGFHAGVLANLAVGDAVSIQPEVLYSQKGAKVANNHDNRDRLNYIDVPIMVQYKINGLFFEVGPQVGVLLNGKTTDGTVTLSLKDPKYIKTVDFGYAGGLGYKLKSGPMFGLRYNGGITNLEPGDNDQPKVRNGAFQLYAGFMFGRK
ncbi:PorT family protein [Hymenobacter sp. BT664]|uniref:PorT family protein n=1 Tax=Hymenobacter montanus TaxID=2771359 RepID=A0A927BED4_9BACT|nr:porin family protein [Hymenobacter montanus]MBD2768735.1 PorT family protein [Hymenobacter montanus]